MEDFFFVAQLSAMLRLAGLNCPEEEEEEEEEKEAE